MRSVALMLLPLVVAAGSPVPAPDGASPPWVADVVGRYTGTVRNAGAMECHRTELTLQDGHLVGHYWIDDKDPFEGTLTDFVPETETSGRFTWTDRYGTGVEALVFSSDRASFAGLWGGDHVDPRNPVYAHRGDMPCAHPAISSRTGAAGPA